MNASAIVDKLLEADIDDPREFMSRQKGEFDDRYIIMADIDGQPAVYGVAHVDIANGDWMTLADMNMRGMSKGLNLYLPYASANFVADQLKIRLATFERVRNIRLVGFSAFREIGRDDYNDYLA